MLLAERTVYRFLHEGLYRRRCDRVRARIAAEAQRVAAGLRAVGLATATPPGNPFLWCDLRVADAGPVSRRMAERGYLFAPGGCFSHSSHLAGFARFNVTTTSDRAIETLREVLADCPPTP